MTDVYLRAYDDRYRPYRDGVVASLSGSGLSSVLQQKVRLHWDVLINVFLFLWSKSDVSSLMRTCSVLYEAGAPYLLSGRVELGYSLSAIGSFSDFINRCPRRALHIRRLFLKGFRPNMTNFKSNVDRSVVALATALRSCQNVTELCIEDTLSIALYDQLSVALESLWQLQTIVFLNVSLNALPLLVKLRSPVTSAIIKFTENIREPPGSLPRDPIFLLYAFRYHLVRLEVYLPGQLNPSWDVTFPLVTSLCIKSDLHRFDWDGIAECFPAVQELTWEGAKGSLPLEISDSTREWNVTISRPEQAWTSLNILRCSIARSNSMALKAQVRYWDTTEVMTDLLHFDSFGWLLDDLRPSCATAGFIMTSLFEGYSQLRIPNVIGGYAHLISFPPSVRLEKYDFAMDFAPIEDFKHILPILVYTILQMSNLSLYVLKLQVLNSTRYDPSIPASEQTLDIDEFAHFIFEKLPTLRYLSFQALETSKPLTGWRAVRSGDQDTIVEELSIYKAVEMQDRSIADSFDDF